MQLVTGFFKSETKITLAFYGCRGHGPIGRGEYK